MRYLEQLHLRSETSSTICRNLGDFFASSARWGQWEGLNERKSFLWEGLNERKCAKPIMCAIC